MTYLSVCSGIEAVSVAWEPLAFTPIGFAEIEKFPCELLKQKYPNVKNYGDITQYEKWNAGQFDILAGGTPCQSFSIAGKRGGTADERGALMYAYLGIVETYRPRWVIWENVPGVLSSNSGYDFASFLAGLEECGYGWAYRVLDAQYFGVPQRRRRVFVIGHSDNRADLAAEVLFKPESMCGNIATGSETQKKTTAAIGKGVNYFRRGGNFKYHKDKKAATLRSSASSDCFDLVLAREKRYIRRLTPLECERLQGFPDNYTQIEWRGKTAEQCPDSLRYKAIGNSMAVPVMRWIGERIKRIKG
ncbi:DNA cytosine methyltransferase [Treponema sp. OMZ 855]|uniref:DNA cytosine methyltransferase n=1 Tax=Treponema sp. OMZ 855 TaxID=1643512 RepID=UPI0020A4C382|nr:DNA (cytosine-5-)-methyltransferase [Treponema sp. OMZ 855]UTC50800.1 DNA (cytosine-5-)-methyltransferase [Treponema sp. OMZ 855]